MATDKRELRQRRRARIRKNIRGTPDRPRLTVFRSTSHIYAQVVDDQHHRVLASAGTIGKAVKDELSSLNKAKRAANVGKRLAQVCKQKGIEKVVFDRNGYLYHGRVRALADAAREAGLQF